MIIIELIKVISKEHSPMEFINVTQLYTMGNHVIIVYEETPLVYKTAKFAVKSLSKMEVEFND